MSDTSVFPFCSLARLARLSPCHTCISSGKRLWNQKLIRRLVGPTIASRLFPPCLISFTSSRPSKPLRLQTGRLVRKQLEARHVSLRYVCRMQTRLEMKRPKARSLLFRLIHMGIKADISVVVRKCCRSCW